MAKLKYNKQGRLLFTKEMKKDYTILCPMMAPIHFRLIVNVMKNCGYHFELLSTTGPNIVQEGLKYVHNDTCYPALLVIGQFIDALHSGKYDLNKTALIITQTGGGCRASNYIHLLRKALKKAGLEQVPVISLNLSFLERNPGFQITLSMVRKFVAGVVYGDALMLLHNQTEAYEINKGDSGQKVEKWIADLSEQFNRGRGLSLKEQRKNLNAIVQDFAAVPVRKTPKVKVGIVGEIYVKYAALGNNNLEEFLRGQDCEINVPGIMGFALFKVDNRLEDIRLYGGSPAKKFVVQKLMNYLTKMQDILIDAVKTEPKFLAPTPYTHTKSLVKDIIGYGDKMGEGWLLTAEMMELTEQGYENIVCAQPFGCLPNHICGKGMIHKIKAVDERSNIVPIDYDPSATRVNQENRIKLMLAVAREKLPNQKGNINQQSK
ncbi:2-hydroxyglutaryl-CoA dehydratase [Clostridium sp. W14A]|uniref:2-hydroxyacyl-CoA dehydratase n=1 Tax=Caproicibacter fermentans TaxID=2576756 RepID=A0A7G8TAQ0_9FIRM|nr:2-hydroxyacyl-CoA dehydratase [Caproicibacter fermentans]OCN02890.1 2-hydroxyglutaryl-CoA dehydratase [Clostridium sp. W14A]QNK40691.1 2-hydroxyacyl-CoA dehydratase [Caproicibacter fermentans]